MLKRKGIGIALRIAVVVAVLASIFAFSVQPASAAALVSQSREPEPPGSVPNDGTGVELFWFKITFDPNVQPVFMTHQIYVGQNYNPANVVHLHAYTFPGSNISANTTYTVGGINSTVELIPDDVSPVYNPENDFGDQEANFQNAEPLAAHAALVPPGVPPGTYTSRVEFFSDAIGAGNVSDPDNLTDFDARAEVTFLVSQQVRIFKYHDLNNSGSWDVGEPGLDNWTFTVVGPAGSIVNPVTLNATLSTISGVTSGGGFFEYTAALSANFTITETILPDWVNTDPANGTGVKIVNVPGDPILQPQGVVARFGNFQLQPGTQVSISAAGGPLPPAGGPLTLTVSETNTGALPLFNISVDVTSGLAAPWAAFTLTKAGPNPAGTTFAGDVGDDGTMAPGETWTWTIPNVAVPANPGPGIRTYTFTAIGSGFTEAGTEVTFPPFETERASVQITVPPPVLVPGISTVGIGLLIAALGALMGLYLYRRSRVSRA